MIGKNSGSVIVSWDFSKGKDTGVLIVGTQTAMRIEVLNAYKGQEAWDLHKKLTKSKHLEDAGKKEEFNV